MPIKYRVGAPSKLEPELVDIFVKAIHEWVPYRIFTLANSIGPKTYIDWMAKGIKDIQAGIESDYANLTKQINKAYYDRVARNTTSIETGDDKFWPGKAWLLERRHQSEFSLQAAEIKEMQDTINELKEMINAKANSSEAKEDSKV